ncbi:transporter substrate-binding domain-containing protein [Haloferula sargassicola]|uniref:Uncharacterized protein n=1 Tax=Haloferula sargassicola TaxID=490096 RepID=A0ABP9UZF2_9BACT
MTRLLAFFSLLLATAFAQETPAPPASEEPLVVAVREVPPFAMKDQGGNWEGLSVDLWQDVADKLNLNFTWQEMPLGETLDGIRDGSVDIGAAALTITAAREETMDFSHPYYVSGLGIGHVADRESAWISTLKGFLSIEFLSTIASLALVLLIAGFAVWWFERKANPEEFQHGAKGLMAGFWWSAVTMTTVGYGDKSPRTLGGRIVALIWMFASLIIIAGFTAAIASSLTANRLKADMLASRPLAQMTVAVVEDSNGDGYATNAGAKVRRFPSVEEAARAVKNGQADVVLHDAPILRYLARTSADWMDVATKELVRDDYGFALASGSPLREQINPALLTILHEDAWKNMQARYLGEPEGE